MATLTVTANHDYSGETLDDITDITFGTLAQATVFFAASQFDGTQISTTVHVTGDANGNNILVEMAVAGTFSAAGWTLTH